MRNVNKVIVLGNVTDDPAIRASTTGSTCANFTVATNRTWTSTTGEKKEETEFHRCVAWGKLGDLCQQFLHKGSLVYIEGFLKTNKWKDTSGNDRQATEIRVDEMISLSPKNGGSPTI